MYCPEINALSINAGAKYFNVDQTTLPSLWCRCAEENAVTTMVAKDVPSAVDMSNESGTPTIGSKYTIIGTITIPPPIPKIPDKKPATQPASKQKKKKVNILILYIYAAHVWMVWNNVACEKRKQVSYRRMLRFQFAPRLYCFHQITPPQTLSWLYDKPLF